MGIARNVGFIGTGALATALATGLCTSPDFTGKVFVSVHRNRGPAEALVQQFGDRVQICESNQSVLDQAEIICPSVLPEQLEPVTAALDFRPDHRVIHVAAGIDLATATRWCALAGSVIRATPLPFASRRTGPMLVFGDDEISEATLGLLGQLVKVNSERDFGTLSVMTGMMAPYYALVGELVSWCQTKGLDYTTGLDFVCLMNEALSSQMRIDHPDDLEAYLRANSTPGGTNELATRTLRETGALQPWRDAAEQIGRRYGV